MKTNCTWEHPYPIDPRYKKRVAYFCMEFGIDTALKIYSGGLGYLAGSHMRSAYSLRQNMIGIGMLWKFGYYDQVRDQNSHMRSLYRERFYSFLQPTDIVVPVSINGHDVQVQAYYLPPEVFGTVPMYLLSTDNWELNDYLSCTISHRLYDPNQAARIAQSIVLGVGGAKVVEKLGGADIYHLNEAHALPIAFHFYEKYGNVAAVKERMVFTTHTPVKAGNEERNIHLLNQMGFFCNVPLDTVRKISHHEHSDVFGYTPATLSLSSRSNGVSQLHAEVSNEMWKHLEDKPHIIGITNAQNRDYWADTQLYAAMDSGNDWAWRARKRDMKEHIFRIVADQTGKIFDPEALTVVWARRFADYKRPDLLARDMERFLALFERPGQPLQVIWAGKPYPEDDGATEIFNRLINLTRYNRHAAVLTGYEINLSMALKKGADVWLNTPRRPKEASGTSGMTAAMNGAINVSVDDGWIPEFARHGHNAFVFPHADLKSSTAEQDLHDYTHMMRILEDEVIPCYYERPQQWLRIVKNSMREILPFFDSHRMADEYYTRMYDSPASNGKQSSRATHETLKQSL